MAMKMTKNGRMSVGRPVSAAAWPLSSLGATPSGLGAAVGAAETTRVEGHGSLPGVGGGGPAAGVAAALRCQETVKPWSLAYLALASCQACRPATASVLSANALPSVSVKFVYT